MRTDLIFAHFGGARFAPDPALSTLRKYFPEARTVMYTDAAESIPRQLFDELSVVVPPYERTHPRYGWRANDLYKAVGLLESRAEVSIYSDADMFYCSEKVRALLPLTTRFGLCLVANPRLLVREDALIGADSDRVLDETEGLGFAYNAATISLAREHGRARAFLERYVEIMKADPVRGPLALYRAAYASGFAPYLLPFQWCVCEAHVGLGDEIALHLDQGYVNDYYAKRQPLWLVKLRMGWRKVRKSTRAMRHAVLGALRMGKRK